MSQSGQNGYGQQQTPFYEQPNSSSNYANSSASQYNQSRFTSSPNTPPVQISQPNTFSQPSSGFQTPSIQPQNNVEYLLAQYTPEQRMKLKSENAQKYNMKYESLVYRFPPRFLEALVQKYPTQFSSQMQEEMSKNLGKLRRDYGFFHRLMFGSILYWAVLRRMAWFKLTGSAIMRVCFVFICFNNMIDIGFMESEYLVQNAFINNTQFENVVTKYNLDPSNISKMELVS